MRPSLTPRGRWFVLGSVAFLFAGAVFGQALLAALGLAALSTLVFLYVRNAPAAAEVFRGALKLAWWLEPEPGGSRAIVAGRPLVLKLALRCHGAARFGVLKLRLVAHAALEVPAELALRVAPHQEARLEARATPRAAGALALHGALLDVDDPLGLFRAQAYFPNPLRLTVLPRALALAPPKQSGGFVESERPGRRLLRRAGVGGELREIREHAHGDPWKRIAWAATARTGQLMVREFESDVVHTYHLIVDATSAMRRGAMGETPLDVAVDGAALVARAALLEGDQVALTVLGAHTSTTVEPGDGGPHLQRIVSALVDSARVSEAGETELTDGELAQIVARYLRHQEGIETQLERAPALDDAGWAHIVTGPRGELYDGHVLARACQRLVGDPARPDAIEPALRRFCRARCLDLPPRLVSPAGHARIIADAIAAASLPRSARALVLWTTLGKEPDTASPVGHEPIARALQLIRRRRHRLIMLLPVASQAALAGDEAVSALAARVDRRRGENAARRLRGLGVTVQLVAAGEPPGAWLRRLSRLGRRPDFPSAPAARPHVGAISGG